MVAEISFSWSIITKLRHLSYQLVHRTQLGTSWLLEKSSCVKILVMLLYMAHSYHIKLQCQGYVERCTTDNNNNNNIYKIAIKTLVCNRTLTK